MRVIIAGPRDYLDYQTVKKAIELSGFDITEEVCGEAHGVDFLGRKWAEAKGIPVVSFPADWEKHGKSAGPIRNGQMADYADALIAVWDGKSKGTYNMINQAKNRKLAGYVFYYLDNYGARF